MRKIIKKIFYDRFHKAYVPTKLQNALKGAQTIGIVDSDNVRFGPVAQVILNRMAVESKNGNVRKISFQTAGIKRTSDQVSNSAKGYLQQKGFGATDLLKPQRIDKYWVKTKDLIVVLEYYLKDKVIFDFFPTNFEEMGEKVLVLNEIVEISDPIRDPGTDEENLKPIYELLERCCKEFIKKLENAN